MDGLTPAIASTMRRKLRASSCAAQQHHGQARPRRAPAAARGTASARPRRAVTQTASAIASPEASQCRRRHEPPRGDQRRAESRRSGTFSCRRRGCACTRCAKPPPQRQTAQGTCATAPANLRRPRSRRPLGCELTGRGAHVDLAPRLRALAGPRLACMARAAGPLHRAPPPLISSRPNRTLRALQECPVLIGAAPGRLVQRRHDEHDNSDPCRRSSGLPSAAAAIQVRNSPTPVVVVESVERRRCRG